MRPLLDMDVIQIEITNACVHQCSNCTRLVGHSKKPFFMEMDFFKKAVDSLVDYPRMIGIMGGEPLLHPQFEEMATYLKSRIPDKIRCGLWSTLPKGREKYASIIADVFGNVLLNDHTLGNLNHSPVLVAAQDSVADEFSMWYLIDHCWIQNCWSASITPKGAFFCEVAAAFDMVFDGPGGWPVAPGWWKKTPKDYVEQMKRYCVNCSAALPLHARRDTEEIDDVSPRNLERLTKVGSPKIKKGKYILYNKGERNKDYHINEFRNNMDYAQKIADKYGLSLKQNKLRYFQPFLKEGQLHQNVTNIDDLLQTGHTHHQAGNLEAASQLYQNILDQRPTHVDANFLLGTLNLQQGNLDTAATLLKKAIALKSDHVRAHSNLGTTLKEQDRLDEAIECYSRSIDLNPDYAEAHYNLGAILQKQGKHNKAVASYNRAIKINPDYADAYYNIGTVLQEQDKLNEAVLSYNKTIALNPNYADAYNNLGNTLQKQGNLYEAIANYNRALEIKPDSAEVYINMGNAFKELGKFNETLSSYRNALRLKPDPGIEVKASLLLPVINESKESIKQHRNRILEQIDSQGNKGLTLEDPYKQVGSTNYYLAYHGLNDKEIQEKIASFYINACPDLVWTSPGCNRQQTHGRIKIGIISTLLFNHTIGKLNHGVIKNLSREKFYVKLFRFSGEKEDHLSKAINDAADEVVILPKKLKPARQEIADHSLDILFYLDIGMDPLTYFLAFSRLAPVQCVTWGHPVTTGIPNMDYFISSDKSEPPCAEDHYSEQLILPDRLTTYYYRPDMPEVLTPRKDFSLPEDYNLYVCPQTLFKFHPDFDNVLGTLLRQDTRGLLVLIEGRHKHWTKLLQDRFSGIFPDVFDRVRFLPMMPTKDFLSLLKLADVILDTPYFCGGGASLESFACGVPVVTWPGKFMRDRLTLALYKQMGIMDCVADNAQSYLDIAFRLANDKAWRNEIKDKIRVNADVLYEDIEAVHELERFFEMAVEEARNKYLVTC